MPAVLLAGVTGDAEDQDVAETDERSLGERLVFSDVVLDDPPPLPPLLDASPVSMPHCAWAFWTTLSLSSRNIRESWSL
jgi:hypothetical protein